MNSPLDFKGYNILKIHYEHTPSDNELPIGGIIPDPESEIRVNPENKNDFIVILNSRIIPEADKEDHQSPIEMEFKVVGFFELSGDIEEEEKGFHMSVSAPSMLFGIIRSWVSQITSNSGLGPVMLPSVQFGSQDDETPDK